MGNMIADTEKTAALAERLTGILNHGALALMISIGHRTGLFDTMHPLAPSTSNEIAAAAQLRERYVREWLAAMVVGRIIVFDPVTAHYHLPPESAALLSRQAGADNVATFCQYIPMLGAVEDRLIACFRNGGGVPYDAYHRFHEVMAEDSGQTVVTALIDAILPLAEGMPELLTRGIDVLDIGCGSGRALNLMAQRYPKSRFVGYDLAGEAIITGRKNATAQGLQNLHFEPRDLTHFDAPESFDLITAFDAIHDQKAPDQVLAGIARALRPGGVFLMQDIAASSYVEKNLDHPLGPFLYTVSCLHCMTVSLAQDGAGLGAMWGEELAVEMLREAGFSSTEVHQLPHDTHNNYYISRKQ